MPAKIVLPSGIQVTLSDVVKLGLARANHGSDALIALYGPNDQHLGYVALPAGGLVTTGDIGEGFRITIPRQTQTEEP
jgi:hypothetical protein